jgi:hypothetical protein
VFTSSIGTPLDDQNVRRAFHDVLHDGWNPAVLTDGCDDLVVWTVMQRETVETGR